MRNQAFCKSRVAAIASGETTSGAVQYAVYRSGSFQMPSAFTGTSFSFLVSADGQTFSSLNHSSGTPVQIAVAVSEAYTLPPELASWPWFKFVSDAAEAAGRSIAVVTKS